MERFKVISFTHKNIPIDKLGGFHIEQDEWKERLPVLKEGLGIEELVYLSTCNRVEFLLSTSRKIDHSFLTAFFATFDQDWDEEEVHWASSKAKVYKGIDAVKHYFEVASSLDSMVIGEREIITQVKKAAANCEKLGLFGDYLRLAVNHTVQTAKQIYTQTQIATRPVSITSLAYLRLKDMDIPLDARVVLVGAGQTITAMSKFLRKHGFSNFTVFNRTLHKAEDLATELNGKALPLEGISQYTKGFDVLITCTGAEEPIITEAVYEQLKQNESHKKVVIDLAVPGDVSKEVVAKENLQYISIEKLRTVAQSNMEARKGDLEKCHAIIDERLQLFKKAFNERQVEIAMRDVPIKVKEINSRAIEEVFAKEVGSLDDQSRETLDKVISYIEKKYISVPMKMAREIIVEKAHPKK